ncbi:carrier protein [Aphelenchoides avenae]|nr:carrier protein [Aphelenchus avenae]
MQSEPHSFRDLKRVLTESLRKEGYATLYRGWSATMLRDIPFSGLYWSGYEFFKSLLLAHLGRERTNFYVSFACGATSGTIAAVLTLPFDVVKTHRQISLGMHANEGKSAAQIRNTATLPIMKEIVSCHASLKWHPHAPL